MGDDYQRQVYQLNQLPENQVRAPRAPSARVTTCRRPILARGLPAVLRRRRLLTPVLPSRRRRVPTVPFDPH